MKKLINLILIMILLPATVNGQQLIDLYTNGKITLNPDPQFSLDLKASPVDNEIQKFNNWLNSNKTGLERNSFFKDFAVNSAGDLYLLANHSQGLVFKFDRLGNYISMFEYDMNPRSIYSSGHSIDIINNEYIVIATSELLLIFDTFGTLKRTIRPDYAVRECIALRDNNIAVTGENLNSESGTWEQHVSIIDIATEKQIKLISFREEKKNMFISVSNDSRRMVMKNPFRRFNTCIDKMNSGDLIIGHPKDNKIHIFSPDGGEKGTIKLNYSAIPVTQTEKDDHYKELEAFYAERKIEISSDELAAIKSGEYVPEHRPYFYDIKVDTDDNILVFKYTKDKDHTFRVYRVYSKEGNYICETKIDSNDYKGPDIGMMKFYKGDLYGLSGHRNKTGEEALVKIGLAAKSGTNVNKDLKSITAPGNWTWVSGDKSKNQRGVYGAKGVAASTNIPGARFDSVGWTDNKGNLWLFGGQKKGGDYFNDLWKFDGSNWTWVSGDNNPNKRGVYGTKGVAAETNIPGARDCSVSWTDSKGNLWLFGGYGYAETRFKGSLNDLWKFDGVNWTWVSGDNKVNQPGINGTRGIAAAENKPGTRYSSVSWTDSKGNLWLFGGIGYAGTGFEGVLNDLWKFDGVHWTWVSGDLRQDIRGVYGTQGIADAENRPGSRFGSVGWTDSKGNLWLFGGSGFDKDEIAGFLNDLWKFDGVNWTWVSGDNTRDQSGVYEKGLNADNAVKPGGRYGSAGWTDSKGSLWLFGGVIYTAYGKTGRHNDLWKFDGSKWTLVSGDNDLNQSGEYVSKGVASDLSMPGARFDSVSWTDSEGNMWLFGGQGYADSGPLGDLNDLWKFKP